MGKTAWTHRGRGHPAEAWRRLRESPEEEPPARIHKRMRQRGSQHVLLVLPRTSVEHSGDSRHDKVFVVGHAQPVVQMREAENHRAHDQPAGAALESGLRHVLNNSAKKNLLRKSIEKED